MSRYSKPKTETISEFWEKKHKEGDIYWLSSTPPQHVYKTLGAFKKILVPNQSVLEIGIGMGHSIRYLSSMQKDIYAVDICEAALEKVIDIAKPINSSTDDEWPVKLIDLALCYLVFQHCDDKAIRFLLSNTIKSLKEDGVFHFQSADAPEDKLDDFYRGEIKNKHIFFRSPEEVTALVEECGGEVIDIADGGTYPDECSISWNIFQVKRA